MRLFSKVLIFFYLVSTHLTATHIHHDHHEHSDCKICHVAQNIDAADIDMTATQYIIVGINYLSSIYHDTYDVIELLKGYHAQAPPSYFL